VKKAVRITIVSVTIAATALLSTGMVVQAKPHFCPRHNCDWPIPRLVVIDPQDSDPIIYPIVPRY
jgi:hypothetical protein